MNKILQVSNSGVLVNLARPKNWISALLMGEISNYKVFKKLGSVSYWLIEVDSQTNVTKRKIPFDVHKCPIIGLSDLDLKFGHALDASQGIDAALFNDLWDLHDKRDFNKLRTVLFKYLDKWRHPDGFEAPIFPCILIDLNNSNETKRFDNVEQLISLDNYSGYEWDVDERLIDSNGNVYLTNFLNFGHPIGVVIPVIIERKINNVELMKILGEDKIDFQINS